MAGQMVHVEIPSDDTEKSRAFWSGLFGWEWEAFEGSPTEYHTTRISDQSGAAITAAEPGKRGPRVYFDVDDVNAGVARVRELGGESRDPMPVPQMGWFATCTDAEGNEFGLWQTDPSAPSIEM
jgi:hypothetical protein